MKQKGRRRKRELLPSLVAPRALRRLPATKGNEAALRQNLRIKVGYDESTIDRLIELERERTPDASLHTLMEMAIERWERDNR